MPLRYGWTLSWTWWRLLSQRQAELCGFEASQSYIVRPRLKTNDDKEMVFVSAPLGGKPIKKSLHVCLAQKCGG